MTFILLMVCSVIGGLIGEYAFDGHALVGALIGFAVGVMLRLGAGGAVGDVGLDLID